MVFSISDLSFYLGIFGTVLLIVGIYLLVIRKNSKLKLAFGIITTVIGGIFLIMSLLRWMKIT